MSAEGIWHSHKVTREGVPEVTTGRDPKKGRGLQALRQGPGARAECKRGEVRKGVRTRGIGLRLRGLHRLLL